MATRTRKSAAKRTRRAAPKKAPTANAAMSATSARRGLGEVFGNMQLTQVAGKLIEGRRRDLWPRRSQHGGAADQDQPLDFKRLRFRA